MPPLVAAIPMALVAAAEVGITGATILGTTGLTAALIAGGATLALGTVMNLASGSRSNPAAAAQIGPSRSPFAVVPDQARTWCYGQAATGGTIKYWRTSGSDNADLWFAVAVHDTEMDSFQTMYIDNLEVDFDGSGNVTTPKYLKNGSTPMMFRYDHLGSETQTADANLVAAAGGEWTTDHRLQGMAYYVWHLVYDQNIYSSGIPTPLIVVKGRKVWDPRHDSDYGGDGSQSRADPSTWTWSANAALCCLDYLLGVTMAGVRIGGCGVPINRLDIDSFITAANIADEDVALHGGGTEKRYTMNGFVDAIEDKLGAVQSMLLAMGGMLTYKGGQISLIAGAAQTTVLSLTDDDLADTLSVYPSVSRQEKVNSITSVYAEPDQLYQVVSAPPLVVPDYETADGGLHLETELRHRFTSSVATAQRLNKLTLGNYREQLSIDAIYKPMGVQISVGNTFTWSSGIAGYSSQKMICLQRDLQENGAVRIVARQETDTKYDWSDSEYLDPPTFSTMTVFDPASVTQPVAIDNTVTGVSITATDGTGQPGIEIDLDVPDSPFVKAIVSEYKKHSESLWKPGPRIENPGDTTRIIITGLAPSTSYDVRIAYVTMFGQSAWTEYDSVLSGAVFKASSVLDGSILAESLAAGLEIVQVVTTISLADTAISSFAFALDTHKIYRWNGTIWDTSVDGGDIIADSIVAGTLAVGAVNAGAIIVDNILVTGHLQAHIVSNTAAATNAFADVSVGVTVDTDAYSVVISATMHLSSTDSIDILANGVSLTGGMFIGGVGMVTLCAIDTSNAGNFVTYSSFSGGPNCDSATIVVTQLKR